MNPISAFFAHQAEARELWALYQRNKRDNSRMIELAQALLVAFGVLDEGQPKTTAEVVAPLAGYTTQWLQESLNLVANAGLEVDGVINGGGATEKAIRAFQVAHPPLKTDGRAGVQTTAVLEAERAKLGG